MSIRLFDRQALLQHPFVDVVLYQFAYRMRNGSWSERLGRIVIDRGNAVAVLLHIVTASGEDRLLLVRQFRYPTYDTSRDDDPDNGWLTELVAGIVDPGERPMMTAHRELVEETGVEAQDMEFICDFFLSPGGSNERTYLFYAQVELDLETLDLDGSHGIEDEDIQLVLLTPQEFLKKVELNQVHDAKTLVAAEWMHRNRAKFKTLM